MSEEKKLKVSDLPEQEQKEILQQAYAAGLKGTFNGWKVETLKQKIKEVQTPKTEQTPVVGEQKETEPAAEPEKEENTESSEAEPVGETEEQKPEQENQTDLDPVQTEPENQPEPKQEGKAPESEKEEKEPQAVKPVKSEIEKTKNKGLCGICHICGSKVVDGVCTGCKFFR